VLHVKLMACLGAVSTSLATPVDALGAWSGWQVCSSWRKHQTRLTHGASGRAATLRRDGRQSIGAMLFIKGFTRGSAYGAYDRSQNEAWLNHRSGERTGRSSL
jgi:hypothetical protein